MKFIASIHYRDFGGMGIMCMHPPLLLPSGTYNIDVYSPIGRSLGRYKITPKDGFAEKCSIDYYQFKSDTI